MTESGIELRPNMPLLGALFVVLFFILTSFTVTSMAASYIVGELGGARTMAVYAISFFGFGSAVSIPLAKPLAARFGEGRVFLGCTLLFACVTGLSAFVPTYFLFIVTRFGAGLMAGPFYPLLAHFFSSLIPSHAKTVLVWVFITFLVVMPVIGACVGGVVAYLYHWTWMFYAYSALTCVTALGVHRLLRHAEIPAMPTGFDWVGWMFYAIGVMTLTCAFTTAQQLDWYRSSFFVAATLIGMVSFGYFVVRSWWHETPVLNLRLFCQPAFSLAMLCLIVLNAVYFGFIILLSLWLTFDANFTPDWIAILFFQMAVVAILPRFIIEKWFGEIDPRIFLLLGSFFIALSCFYTTLFNVEINLGRIAFSRILAGLGLALFLPPIFQIVSTAHPPERWIEVFELFQGVRNLASSLGASLFGIAWQRRTVFFHERLSENLQQNVHGLKLFFRNIEQLHVPGDPAAHMEFYLSRRASSLALDDIFYLMGWIVCGLFFLIALSFLIYNRRFKTNP